MARSERRQTPREAGAAVREEKSVLAVNARRSIRERTIIDRLEEFFGREITTHNAPIENYIRGGPGAVRALAASLNRFDHFHDDGLGLTPSDLQGIETIGEVVIAIVVWYRRNGWNVVFR
ncbi:MAG TPA: hypothetical protein VFK86_07235 [Bauldia sp.]|nr:hypothetical protein [Bauldia sp.]